MEDMYIEGYAIVYNTKTLLYEYEGRKYYEIISQDALTGCDISDVVLRYNHSDQVFIVAGTKNGTLQLINDSRGLKIRAKLVNTTVGRDLYEMIKEKLIQKMSFAFIIAKDTFDIDSRTRTVERIKRLIDTSAVDHPAYPTTSIYVLDNDQIRRQNELEVERLKRNIKLSEIEFERDSIRRKADQ